MTVNPTKEDLLHWSAFGQPGQPQAYRVTASDRQGRHEFKQPHHSAWNVHIPKDGLEKLLNGFQPREMEDKWFIYADGPDDSGHAILHMHRSWTGRKVFEIAIEGAGNKGEEIGNAQARITGLKWEFDSGYLWNKDAEKAKDDVREVCRWILGVELSEG